MEKGQMTVIGLILIFVALVVLSRLMPTIIENIEYAKNYTDTMTDVILDLLPFLFVIGIVIGIIVYAAPHRAE